jgi:replicative DNA helicase
MGEKVNNSLAENLLALLCYNAEVAPLIRNTLTPEHFENSIFRTIARAAMDFLDNYNEPIKTHLPDVLEHILLDEKEPHKAELFRNTILTLHESREQVNAKYAITQLNTFVRTQALKAAIVKAAKAVEKGNLDQAELEILNGLKEEVVSFDKGLLINDPKEALKFLERQEESFQTGIKILDNKNICPRRKEMFLIIAPAKKGKTWSLIHLGKAGLLQHLKVLHVSLEMSEELVAQRYLQSFFAMSMRDDTAVFSKIDKDEDGQIMNVIQTTRNVISSTADDIKTILTAKIEKNLKTKQPLIIKAFPTGALTVSGLKVYMDTLERTKKFIPDILIIDYPDLMKIQGPDVRIATSKIYKDLRGLAVERNISLITASQGNRVSASAKVITDSMIAEDFSKIATADNVLTLNQTEDEKSMGLMRIFVSNARNSEDKFTFIVTQNYSVGQFAIDSALMPDDYFTRMDIQN